MVKPGGITEEGRSAFCMALLPTWKTRPFRQIIASKLSQSPVCTPIDTLTILSSIKEVTGTGKYVFPGFQSIKRPMSENALNGALRRLGSSGDAMTSHGFRAMASTLLNEMGKWHPDAIERQLAHAEADAVRRAYARGEYWDERVAMMQAWSDYLDGAARS